jgi:hypothetical protein
MLFVFIYIYWCPTWIPYQMMFVSFNPYNTNGSKDESNIVFMRKSQRTSQHEIKNMMTCKLTTWTTLTTLRQIKGCDDYRCSGRLQEPKSVQNRVMSGRSTSCPMKLNYSYMTASYWQHTYTRVFLEIIHCRQRLRIMQLDMTSIFPT